jgi:hypothetical protein
MPISVRNKVGVRNWEMRELRKWPEGMHFEEDPKIANAPLVIFRLSVPDRPHQSLVGSSAYMCKAEAGSEGDA